MRAWTQTIEPGPALVTIFLVLFVSQTVFAAPTSPEEQSTDIEYYPVADATGCYYNFQHYDEGDRIITNEPCLNCTCHNRMLMCYLRVCPFTKAIGADCKVEKRADQCCPVITCPEVPVQLLTSTLSSTAVGHLNEYGCSIDSLFYSDGARVPSNPNNPCELCYCIRNKTACVMQECTLNVEGCRPVYQEGVCCPVRYDCEHPNYLETTPKPLLTTTTTTTTTLAPTTTVAPSDCIFHGQLYADGALVKKDIPCEQCYCMRGDIVCAVQECGPTPLDKVNCTALPPVEGHCCPDTYDCENLTEEDLTTISSYDAPTTQPSVPTQDHRIVFEEETEPSVTTARVSSAEQGVTLEDRHKQTEEDITVTEGEQAATEKEEKAVTSQPEVAVTESAAVERITSRVTDAFEAITTHITQAVEALTTSLTSTESSVTETPKEGQPQELPFPIHPAEKENEKPSEIEKEQPVTPAELVTIAEEGQETEKPTVEFTTVSAAESTEKDVEETQPATDTEKITEQPLKDEHEDEATPLTTMKAHEITTELKELVPTHTPVEEGHTPNLETDAGTSEDQLTESPTTEAEIPQAATEIAQPEPTLEQESSTSKLEPVVEPETPRPRVDEQGTEGSIGVSQSEQTEKQIPDSTLPPKVTPESAPEQESTTSGVEDTAQTERPGAAVEGQVTESSSLPPEKESTTTHPAQTVSEKRIPQVTVQPELTGTEGGEKVTQVTSELYEKESTTQQAQTGVKEQEPQSTPQSETPRTEIAEQVTESVTFSLETESSVIVTKPAETSSEKQEPHAGILPEAPGTDIGEKVTETPIPPSETEGAAQTTQTAEVDSEKPNLQLTATPIIPSETERIGTEEYESVTTSLPTIKPIGEEMPSATEKILVKEECGEDSCIPEAITEQYATEHVTEEVSKPSEGTTKTPIIKETLPEVLVTILEQATTAETLTELTTSEASKPQESSSTVPETDEGQQVETEKTAAEPFITTAVPEIHTEPGEVTKSVEIEATTPKKEIIVVTEKEQAIVTETESVISEATTPEEELVVVTEVATKKTEKPESMDHISETALPGEAPKKQTEVSSTETSSETPESPADKDVQTESSSPEVSQPSEQTQPPQMSVTEIVKELPVTTITPQISPISELPQTIREQETTATITEQQITEKPFVPEVSRPDENEILDQPETGEILPEITTQLGLHVTEEAILPTGTESAGGEGTVTIKSEAITESNLIPEVTEETLATTLKEEHLPHLVTESNAIPEIVTKGEKETNEIPEGPITIHDQFLTVTSSSVSVTDEVTQKVEESSGEEPGIDTSTEIEGSGQSPQISEVTEHTVTESMEVGDKTEQEQKASYTLGLPEVTSKKPDEVSETGSTEELTTESETPLKTSDRGTEKLPQSEVPEQATTEYIIETTSLDLEHGIPGEGNCLVGGRSYRNNTSVPAINRCQTSCKCISSILQCESIDCTPPPASAQNCLPVFQGPESCCPTYSCAPVESTSQALTEVVPEEITTLKKVDEEAATTETFRKDIELTSQVPVEEQTISSEPEVTDAGIETTSKSVQEEQESQRPEVTLPEIQTTPTEKSTSVAQPQPPLEENEIQQTVQPEITEQPAISESCDELSCRKPSSAETSTKSTLRQEEAEVQKSSPTTPTSELIEKTTVIDVTQAQSLPDQPTDVPTISELPGKPELTTVPSEKTDISTEYPLILETELPSEKIPASETVTEEEFLISTRPQDESIKTETEANVLVEGSNLTTARPQEGVTTQEPKVVKPDIEETSELLPETTQFPEVSPSKPEESPSKGEPSATTIGVEPYTTAPIKPEEGISEIQTTASVAEGTSKPEVVTTTVPEISGETSSEPQEIAGTVSPQEPVTQRVEEVPLTEISVTEKELLSSEQQPEQPATIEPVQITTAQSIVPERVDQEEVAVTKAETIGPEEVTEVTSAAVEESATRPQIPSQSTPLSPISAETNRPGEYSTPAVKDITEIPVFPSETSTEKATEKPTQYVEHITEGEIESETAKTIESESHVTEPAPVVVETQEPQETTSVSSISEIVTSEPTRTEIGTKQPEEASSPVDKETQITEKSESETPKIEKSEPTESIPSKQETETSSESLPVTESEHVTRSEQPVDESKTVQPERPSEGTTQLEVVQPESVTQPDELEKEFEPLYTTALPSKEEASTEESKGETEQPPIDNEIKETRPDLSKPETDNEVDKETPVKSITEKTVEPEIPTDVTRTPVSEFTTFKSAETRVDTTSPSVETESVTSGRITVKPELEMTHIPESHVPEGEGYSTEPSLEGVTQPEKLFTEAEQEITVQPDQGIIRPEEGTAMPEEQTSSPEQVVTQQKEEITTPESAKELVTQSVEELTRPQEALGSTPAIEETSQPQSVTEQEKVTEPTKLEQTPSSPLVSEEGEATTVFSVSEPEQEKESETTVKPPAETYPPERVQPISTIQPEFEKSTETAYTSPHLITQGPPEQVNISLPDRGAELFTSGPPTPEIATKAGFEGELSTSVPLSSEPPVISQVTTITPTISTSVPPAPIPGEQVPELPDYQQPDVEYEDEDQNSFGPGTCRYGGKVYVSAQQIPRDDPCDFCFCFRSDIICLQQSCPPPIPRCHEEPIRGFCCPRYECPVSMATAVNITTSTTTTTTTLPPHFLSHAYKGRAQKTGCQIKGQAYRVGDAIKSASGPCLHCTCGGDGQMKCDPKPCSPEPMLRQMIEAAASRKRR